MDISKLPKLSNTAEHRPLPASSEAVPARAADGCFCTQCGAAISSDMRFCGKCGSPTAAVGPAPAGTAEIWIALAIGVIVLLLYPRLLQFISHKLFGTYFAPFLNTTTGLEVPYTSLADFWSDLGITLFGVVLVVDGLAMALVRARMVVLVAFMLTLIATGYNLVFLATHFQPLPIISALAVGFGIYIAIYQLTLLRTLKSAKA